MNTNQRAAPRPGKAARQHPPATSPWTMAKTVAWGFFGVRRRGDHDTQVSRVNPLHVVVAGFVGVLLFVAGLMLLVNWVAAP